LTRLDTRMLAERVGDLGRVVTTEAIEDALPGAWRTYDEAVRSGTSRCTWKAFMSALLSEACVDGGDLDEVVDHLWREQPARNLWREPVPGMIDVVDALRDAGLPVGVVSNSEGRVAELLAELGWLDRFAVVADSGKLGMEKPDERIFRWACDAMGVAPDRVVHIGDSRSADIDGALGVGMRAIWFRGTVNGQPPHRVRVCASSTEVMRALREWGALLA